jgi:Tol biopolymer transport system component
MKKILFLVVSVTAIAFMFSFKVNKPGSNSKATINDTLLFPGEKHFANMQQLTFGGDNAEAYFSFDGKYIVFQKTYVKEGIECDQIFVGKVPAPGEKFEYKRISNGKGRTTCGAFLKDGKHVVFASTHLADVKCPPTPDRAKYGNKYIWPLYSGYDIFMADLNGNIVKQLTSSKAYDAEATISPDGKKMLYTST